MGGIPNPEQGKHGMDVHLLYSFTTRYPCEVLHTQLGVVEYV